MLEETQRQKTGGQGREEASACQMADDWLVYWSFMRNQTWSSQSALHPHPSMMDIKPVGLITCLLCDVTPLSAGGLKSELTLMPHVDQTPD